MIVYLLLNQVNGKGYVGQHKGYRLSRRWDRNLSRGTANPHFRRAVQKYGPHAFQRKVLACCSCQQEMDLLEKFWIRVWQTTNPRFGYNIQSGGIGAQHTEESRRRIAEARKRYWTSGRRKAMARTIRQVWQNRTADERTEITEKMSQSMIQVRKTIPPWDKGKVGPNAGKPRTSETKRKVSTSMKLYWASQEVKQAKRQLREIKERLDALSFELQGGCTW
jgi:group I intron endonuclease